MKRCLFRSVVPSAVLTLLLFSLLLRGGDGEKIDPMTLPAEDFLRVVRHVPSQETWAKMSGTAQHKRAGARRIKAPVRLAIRFTPARIVARLIFNDSEIYDLGQAFDPPIATTEVQLKPGTEPKLGLYGIDVSDMTLSFIYKETIREEKPERVSIFPCRVFMLKGSVEGETARVFVSTEYFFPVRVQWFRKDPGPGVAGEPYRELEIASVKKADDNDFYLIPKLEISGPNWRTKIDFDERSAGYAKDGMPKDLFVGFAEGESPK